VEPHHKGIWTENKYEQDRDHEVSRNIDKNVIIEVDDSVVTGRHIYLFIWEVK
jgi:pyrimidine operon attenuation protein/uracil phosphoribosyltransferase